MIKKVLITLLILVVVVIIGAVVYLKMALPNVDDAPDLKIIYTPKRIAHGKYLANHVTLCMDCHSTRDWSKFTAPPIIGTLGKGGEYFGPEVGFPGSFYSKNITPSHLKNWTDGEIFRAITTGVDKDGNALFPVMPYLYYGKMDTEDIYAIIAYIRTLEPIENQVPERDIEFPMNLIVNTIPQTATATHKPSKTDTLAYGAYLTNAAACMECHTQVENGQIIKELAFMGGREFPMPNGLVRSANITPDDETGIGLWSENAFIARFKAYSDPNNAATLTNNDVNTIMPWNMMAGMDDSDLAAIYKYLQSLKPVKNEVVHFQVAANTNK